MSYKQALTLGWAVFWRQMWWSALISLPLLLVSVIWTHGNPSSSIAVRMQSPPVVFVLVAAWLFIPIPQSVRGAIEDVYSGFRVYLSRANHAEKSLTYWETLQISLVSFAFQVAAMLILITPHLSDRLGPLIFGATEFAFSVFVIFPAIWMLIIHFPFRGFRVAIAADRTLEPGLHS